MRDSPRLSSNFRGAVLASLAIAVTIFTYILVNSFDNFSIHDIVSAFVTGFLLGFPVSAAVMFIAGLPLVMLLRRLGIYSFWTVVTVAATVGAAANYVIANFASSQHSVNRPLIIGAIYGLIAGCAFYLGARPNNSFKPNALRYSNKLAEKACQFVASATHVGLIQALAPTAVDRLTCNYIVVIL